MLLDSGIDQLTMGGKGAQRRLFVIPHEAAVAENVGAEYGGELSLHYPPLMTERARAWRRCGTVCCQDLHPLPGAIEEQNLEVRGDESLGHPRSHRAQANKTDH
jgi:hypothetical protein